MYEQQINAYFDDPARRVQLVEAISRLVRIRSVREEPQPGMPFGPGPAAALDEALKLAGELGFATKNYDNYVGAVDLNDKDTALHILCHLDVVGEGTGWTVTEPYEPKEVDGMLYGRGTDDDKGPAVAAWAPTRRAAPATLSIIMGRSPTPPAPSPPTGSSR